MKENMTNKEKTTFPQYRSVFFMNKMGFPLSCTLKEPPTLSAPCSLPYPPSSSDHLPPPLVVLGRRASDWNTTSSKLQHRTVT